METGTGAATPGAAEAEPSTPTAEPAAGAGEIRKDDGHAPESERANQTSKVEAILARVEKSLQAVHAGQTALEHKFDTHIHQPVEVRSTSNATPEPAKEPATAPEATAEPAAAPTPEASTPPPAPKVARGIGPLHHSKGRNKD